MMRLLIDTDTASDDAVALVMALRDPDVVVEAITVVAGNVPLDQAVQNALYTVELCGRRTPVHAGADRPLTRPLTTAHEVHGADGMGDIGLPLAGRQPDSNRAVDVLIETILGEPGEITLVTLGPLTNVALALQRAPELAGAVARCVIMGGAGDGPGNVTEHAEYNIFVDPEAVAVVLKSGMPMTLVGWDITVQSAWIDEATANELLGLDTELARFAIGINGVLDRYAKQVSGLVGLDLADPMAMAVVLDPDAAELEPQRLAVLLGDEPHRGRLVRQPGEPNVGVAVRGSRDRFLGLLRAALS